MTLKEVLCVDVMEDLEQAVTSDRSRDDDGVERTHQDTQERLGMWAWGKPREREEDDAQEDGTGRVLCGQRIVRVAVNAFGVSSNLLAPGQSGEAAVKENLGGASFYRYPLS